ncbi:excinuclease ABC subunit UvrB [Candidatus Woesearchaeota archaeon]|nr:excinuclease ABC subunit UvrB [Candidatus Woesearchaeota archaeon]
MDFKLVSDFKPKGSQEDAIADLVSGMKKPHSTQTLLGVTGSGKTFTMANVIAKANKPVLVIAHNKTLAQQLYQEFKDFFPENRVEFFISYYDYYQPESYIPSKDQYIEKDAQINPQIERMRMAATASLLSRNDTIVIASVSAIYNVGNPEDFHLMGFEVKKGEQLSRKQLIEKFVNAQYERNDTELAPGRFRVKGDTIDFVPGSHVNVMRIEMFGDEIERIAELENTTSDTITTVDYYFVYPAKHFVTPDDKLKKAMISIKDELDETLPELEPLEEHRLKQRTMYDLEMIQETGFCKGIENYSRHMDGRKPGEQPFSLLDYFPDDSIIIIDESHQTIPQLHAMANGDRARKRNLIQYGFRLPSAYDNRPLRFDETEKYLKKRTTIFLSATPSEYEKKQSQQIVEQIIRPTGLVDPIVEVRPIEGQIHDLKDEIQKTIKRGFRALVTTLTKKLAEELAEFLAKEGIKTRYLHSEIDTLERTEILRQLRLGEFDVLVGINLLREGLDIPEVAFIGILDADKEGFLRDARSLIQTIGRAARNADSHVVLYADKMTDSMKAAIHETNRRRSIQLRFNKKHNIVPKTIIKPIREQTTIVKDTKHIPKAQLPELMAQIEADMKRAADQLDFELAIELRVKLKQLQQRLEKE